MTRTQLARRTHAQHRAGALTRRIVGTPAEVAATVAVLRDSGRLLFMDRTQQTGADRVTVTVRFLDTPGPAPAPVRRLRRGPVIAAVTVSTVGVLAGVGYLAAQLTHTVRAAFPGVVGVVLVLVVLALLLRRKTRCAGLHCAGCNH
ncbi:hypothetical protein GCE86_24745 [Micromonospora terminaliae]|uniref:Uncharacterized protein n=1 Tax=Micromonospora terminaliae TaxID=1914461 RepID=A0AAJ2ZH81_9ACTN|nr:hypothetical protein [Micromonospora terminaliae]NES29878.1 hypothetical protein [Micromonospora terminaliae]QGL49945.1 hypothetical protein GCE86_24745 [Micromonospora terminaliae]